MLYNGYLFYFGRLIFISFTLLLIHLLLNRQFFIKFSWFYFNDSIIFLYLLSSPIFTIVFFGLLVCAQVLKTKESNNSSWIIISLFIALSYFITVNPTEMFVLTFFKTTSMNTTLQNGLLNIHPFIIYYIYSVALILWAKSYKYALHFFSLVMISTYLLNMIYITFFGIILGAFWAAQELNWGGFWSWDPVELISLMLFFYFVKLFHMKSFLFISRIRWFMIIIIILLILFVIRFGIINTIHSFVRSNQNNFAIKIGTFVASLWLGWALWKHLVVIRYSSKHFLSIFNWIYIALLNIIIIYLFYLISSGIFAIISWINIRIASMYAYLFFFILYYDLYKSPDWQKPVIRIAIVFCCLCINNVFIVFILTLYLIYSSRLYTVATIHLWLITLYGTSMVFFVNIPIYTSIFFVINDINVQLSQMSSVQTYMNYYESFFYVKKTSLIEHLKNINSHVLGFNIYTNIFNSIYCFSKNIKLHFLFCEELIFWNSVFIFLMLTWQKYLLLRHTYFYHLY